MRKLLTVVLLIGVAAPASAQTGRFEANNPWYEHFAADCRVGNGMRADCQEGVLTAYKQSSDAQEVTCDFTKFWAISDEKMKDKYFPVLPWQYGVEAIIAEPGVCGTF